MCNLSIAGLGTQVKDNSNIHIFELKDLVDGSEYEMIIELSTPTGASIGGYKVVDDSYKFYTHVGDLAIVLFRAVENYNSIDIEVSTNKEANVKMELNGETYTGLGKNHNTSFNGLNQNTFYTLSVDLSVTDEHYGTIKTHSEEYVLKTKNADEFVMNHAYSTTINSTTINVSTSYLTDVEIRIVGAFVDRTETKIGRTLHDFSFITLDENTTYTIYLKSIAKEGVYIGNELTDSFTIKTLEDTESRYFKTKWNMNLDFALNLKIPLDPVGNYDFDIDWGDGTPIEHYTNSNVQHNYASTGVYIVKILGTCEGFGFNDGATFSGNISNLIDILQWGTVRLHNLGFQFSYCDQITVFSAIDILYFDNITTLESFFEGASHYNSDVSWIKLGNVTSIKNMFKHCNEFNYVVDTWDTSKVVDMEGVFYDAPRFNRSLWSWSFENVETTAQMFRYAAAFNSSMPNDYPKLTTMYRMFYHAIVFSQSTTFWNLPSPEPIMTEMFIGSGLASNEPSWYTP